jgi:hypothetical protein
MKKVGFVLIGVVIVLLIWANASIGWNSNGFAFNGLVNLWIHAILINISVFYWGITILKTSKRVKEKTSYKVITYIAMVVAGILIAVLLIPVILLFGAILTNGRL